MIAKLQKLKNKKGFTLVELIVVIAIIAILTAVLIPVIGNYTKNAAETSGKQAAAEIKQAVSIACTDVTSTSGTIISTDSVTKAAAAAGSAIAATNGTLAAKCQAALADIDPACNFTATVTSGSCTQVVYTKGNMTVTLNSSGSTVTYS